MTTVDEEAPLDEDIRLLQFPVAYDFGFPQRIVTSIFGYICTISWRYNSYDGALIMRLVRTVDSTIVFQGKVALLTPIVVLEPTTGIPIFIIFADALENNNLQVFALSPGLLEPQKEWPWR